MSGSHDRPTSQQDRQEGLSGPAAALLARIEREDAIGQLRRREGAMLRLGSENGIPMLDWVEAVPRLLADPDGMESVERDARELVERGMRHILWSGMGGSVLTVQVLRALGFCAGEVTIYPLDSTDPQALNSVVRQLANAKGIPLPSEGGSTAEVGTPVPALRALLADVMMIGVAMGRTSEEPISHLVWFSDVLRQGGLAAADHVRVMCIPDSYLESYAREQRLAHMPLQLDGGHGTPGRMSAPGTRVFLLPVALDLAARGAGPGTLRALLQTAWSAYDLDAATAQPGQHPFVRLAAILASISADGACGLVFAAPPGLDALRWWMEQLMEESLGKGGKGIVVFSDQTIVPPRADDNRMLPELRVRIVAGEPGEAERINESVNREDAPSETITLYQALLASPAAPDRLAGVAALFLGLQLSTALYGYLCNIPFAGQPAVEDYKRRARDLRAGQDSIRVALAASTPLVTDRFTLLPPPKRPAPSSGTLDPALATLAALAALAAPAGGLSYLDLTINGELTPEQTAAIDMRLRHLGGVLGAPVKLRRAPAAYHSTEQSEMDGPPDLVSLRTLARQSEPCLIGKYDATFLRAQATGTWLAMNERGRTCVLLLYDGTNDELAPALCALLDRLASAVVSDREGRDASRS